MNSYKRLKAENQKLLQDMRKVVVDDCLITKLEYRNVFMTEDAIWRGGTLDGENKFNGLLEQAK